MDLNGRALMLFAAADIMAEEWRVSVTTTSNGARLVDLGVHAPGGLDAGLIMAHVCMAYLGQAAIVPGEFGLPTVSVRTDWPVAACMASQYAGWVVKVGKYFAMGSGPMRAAAEREELFSKIGHTEQASAVIGTLETRTVPSEEVADYIAQACRVPPGKVTLLFAPTASLAGTVQVVARSVETALHKLFELGFDLNQVVSAFGTAPLPPVAKDDFTAIGWTNDAILYGGRVTLWVKADDAVLAEVGPRVPACASKDYGEPFAAVFERCGRDFYQIDPLLFSPAEVTFHNLASGKTHRFGRVAPDVLRRSFLE